MAFKLPFTLPTLDRRNRSPQTPGVVPLVERRSNRGNRLPLIGHLEIQTQFRILGTVFLISLLIAIASVFIQAQATARGTAYLSVANHIPTLTQQIPRAAVNATLGQKEGFTELREGRDQFARTLETLAEGGEVKGVKVAATSTEARPALDALREGWTRQSDAISLLLAQENRLVAINKLATDSAKQSKAITEAAEAAGGKFPVLTERILRAASQLAWGPGFDEAVAAQLAKDITTATELAPAESPLGQSLKPMQAALASLSGDLKPLTKARATVASLVSGFRGMTATPKHLVKAYENEIADQDASFSRGDLRFAGAADAGAHGQGLQRRRPAPQQRGRSPAPAPKRRRTPPRAPFCG
jgi:hypothetical protein